MKLIQQLEYGGNCLKVIDYLKSIFNDVSYTCETYQSFPSAEIMGVKQSGLQMIYKSIFTINQKNTSICLNLSDSMLAAMEMSSFGVLSMHIPQIITSTLVNKNDYNIEWVFDKNKPEGIFQYLEFDGFCQDVINHYENAFDIKADFITKYKNSPVANEVGVGGGEKIYSALLNFKHENKNYGLKLCDTIASAKNNINTYDPSALLFYKNSSNPLFAIKDDDENVLQNIFAKLSVGAKLNKPLTKDENGIIHGNLIDKYGVCWDISLS